MKLIFEFARIAAFCFAGEVCHLVLPLPIPASVYGLMLLLAALRFGVVKLEQVRTAALFLTGIFPLLFVPAAAGVMDLWADLQAMLVPVLLALIPSAEGTGSIDHACTRMATYYEREHKMNQQVGNSMMYPLILCVLIVAVIAILMTFVLPQFKPMFDQMEKLPFLTQLLFDASDFVGANWPLLLVALALIFFGFKLLLAQPRIRRQWDRFILHAPVVGVLNRKICTARFASTLSNLYGSGVPIITTLGAARDSIGNRWIESQFGTALDSIRAGHSLSQSIAAIDGFEVKLASSIAVGEETGKLDSLLATISETLDYEAEMATKRLVTLLEPVMIVIMGLVVGGVVAAVIVPIYQSYGTIGASSGAI